MSDLMTVANSIAGVVSPILTQLVRSHLFKWDDKAAHWLSLVVAAICVGAAMWSTHTPFVWSEFGADVGIAFTISQVVYHNFMHDGGNPPVDGDH